MTPAASPGERPGASRGAAMIESFATYLGEVPRVSSTQGARACLARLAGRLGVPLTLVVRTRDDPDTGFPLPEHYDTDLECFDEYLRVGLYRRDPLFLAGLAARRPILMPFDRRAWGAMAPAEEEAFEARVRREAAYRIVTPGAAGAGGVRWVVAFSSEDRLDDAEASRATSVLWLAAAAMGERLLQLGGEAREEVRLDPAEREALVRLAAGQGGATTAARLGLTEAAVSALLARAGRKLGARSAPEALGRALARGAIEP